MKSHTTLELEQAIYRYVRRHAGLFCCFEVTIGWFGSERVDFLTYDTEGTWRCYEIKSCLADFRSKHKKTFVGHLNYYVMPSDLYDKVKLEIPRDIGVFCPGYGLMRKPKRRQLAVEEKVLFASMVRSLYREAESGIRTKMREAGRAG